MTELVFDLGREVRAMLCIGQSPPADPEVIAIIDALRDELGKLTRGRL